MARPGSNPVDPLQNKFLTRRSLFPRRSVSKRTVYHPSLILGAYLVLKRLVNAFVKGLQHGCKSARDNSDVNISPGQKIFYSLR